MALNLRKGLPKSTTLYIYDIITTIVDDFAAHCKSFSLGDVVACRNCREVASNSVSLSSFCYPRCKRILSWNFVRQDVAFVIVPEGSHVRTVFLDPVNGLLAGAVDDKTFIDCSTIDTATSLAIAKAAAQASPSACYFDAPVSGGTAGAEAASLTFMVGAQQDDAYFHLQLEPLLKLMGRNVFCLGGPSLGLVAKLSNNYLSGIIAIATSEAMNLGMRHGIDPRVLSECFKRSSGGNWVNGTSEFCMSVPDNHSSADVHHQTQQTYVLLSLISQRGFA